MAKKTFTKNRIWLRTVLQIFFFMLIALIVVNHTLEDNGVAIPLLSSASLHAVCPFGGVESLYHFATEGAFTQKIHESSFILMVLVFILAFLFGSVFCGWVCPLGSVQEWVGKLGKRLFKKRYNQFIPHRIDQYLRYLRYIMLIWVLYATAMTGKLAFGDIDPYYALFNFWTGEVAVTGLAVLGITLLASLAVERPWCKYVCPYGAVLGITNLFSVFSIRRQESTCKPCNVCTRNCPMNIPVHAVDVVRDHQCIGCLECTSEAICPIENTVVFATKRPLMEMRSKTLSVTIAIVIFGGIMGASALGLWKTQSSETSRRTPSKIQVSESVGETVEGIVEAYNPADIRGSHRFGEISELFNIPLEILSRAFALPADVDPATFQNRDFETIYPEFEGEQEIGNGSMKWFVALYTGLPYELETDEEDTYLLRPAVDILKSHADLTAEQIAYLDAHTIEIEIEP